MVQLSVTTNKRSRRRTRTASTQRPTATWRSSQQQNQRNQNPQDSEWIISIYTDLVPAHGEDVAGSWAKTSIYRIPQSLRQGDDDKAYVPHTVSLGPYHHAHKRLQKMERHKWRAVYRILLRTNQDIELYLTAVRELEDNARSCYEGPIDLTSNDFVKMMVLDSCFVLELFRGAAVGFTKLGYARDDPVFAMRGAMHSIQRDMIMLENQIPLFVLDKLNGIQNEDPELTGDVASLAVEFFDPLVPTNEALTSKSNNQLNTSDGDAAANSVSSFDPSAAKEMAHCLDVFRRSLLAVPKSAPPASILQRYKKWSLTVRVADKRRQQLIHCVTELKAVGMKFKRKRTDRFWDISYKKGVLEIPRLLIHDGTRSLFLNLIAFEQCHFDCSNDITAYVVFMDNLIDSPADVSYLHECGIIENWLGSDEAVADLFNKLCHEVVFDLNKSSLSSLSEDVNKFYKRKWNCYVATLSQTYFGDPWSVTKFLAATALLFLTAAQTFYTIYAYYKPHL